MIGVNAADKRLVSSRDSWERHPGSLVGIKELSDYEAVSTNPFIEGEKQETHLVNYVIEDATRRESFISVSPGLAVEVGRVKLARASTEIQTDFISELSELNLHTPHVRTWRWFMEDGRPLTEARSWESTDDAIAIEHIWWPKPEEALSKAYEMVYDAATATEDIRILTAWRKAIEAHKDQPESEFMAGVGKAIKDMTAIRRYRKRKLSRIPSWYTGSAEASLSSFRRHSRTVDREHHYGLDEAPSEKIVYPSLKYNDSRRERIHGAD